MMNTVQLIGNLARDPQLRTTKTGSTVAAFTVAVKHSYTTPQGEQKELTDWINVVAWGNLGKAVASQLKKGSRMSNLKRLRRLIATHNHINRQEMQLL